MLNRKPQVCQWYSDGMSRKPVRACLVGIRNHCRIQAREQIPSPGHVRGILARFGPVFQTTGRRRMEQRLFEMASEFLENIPVVIVTGLPRRQASMGLR